MYSAAHTAKHTQQSTTEPSTAQHSSARLGKDESHARDIALLKQIVSRRRKRKIKTNKKKHTKRSILKICTIYCE